MVARDGPLFAGCLHFSISGFGCKSKSSVYQDFITLLLKDEAVLTFPLIGHDIGVMVFAV